MLDTATPRDIARLFLPSRWHYHYARAKLATDPLYTAVAAALAGTSAPLLDLGCGIGLLPHYCRTRGIALPYLGVDNDGRKIELACRAAERAGLPDARFETLDLSRSFPAHRGSVAVLDMLQYLPPPRMSAMLRQAAECVTPAGILIIRTGLQDTGWRARVTRGADVLARAIRWMNASPRMYPSREFLVAQLRDGGLEPEFTPLWGRTPFNNWLIVARRVV